MGCFWNRPEGVFKFNTDYLLSRNVEKFVDVFFLIFDTGLLKKKTKAKRRIHLDLSSFT